MVQGISQTWELNTDGTHTLVDGAFVLPNLFLKHIRMQIKGEDAVLAFFSYL